MAKKSHFKLPPSEMTKEVPRHSLPTESVSLSWKNRALSRKTLLTKSPGIFQGDGHSAAGVSPSLPPTPPQFQTKFSISRGVGNLQQVGFSLEREDLSKESTSL